jgi:hypothetical protein
MQLLLMCSPHPRTSGLRWNVTRSTKAGPYVFRPPLMTVQGYFGKRSESKGGPKTYGKFMVPGVSLADGPIQRGPLQSWYYTRIKGRYKDV